jgi:hypothetical protein
VVTLRRFVDVPLAGFVQFENLIVILQQRTKFVRGIKIRLLETAEGRSLVDFHGCLPPGDVSGLAKSIAVEIVRQSSQLYVSSAKTQSLDVFVFRRIVRCATSLNTNLVHVYNTVGFHRRFTATPVSENSISSVTVHPL